MKSREYFTNIDYIFLLCCVIIPLLVLFHNISSPVLLGEDTEQNIANYNISTAVAFLVVGILFMMRFVPSLKQIASSPLWIPSVFLSIFIFMQFASIAINSLSSDMAVDELISLKHWIMTLPTFFPLFVAIGSRNFHKTRNSFIVARWIVAPIAVISALSFLFLSHPLGEVQGLERGAIRSFGVLGDTSAFYISFFAFSFLRTRSWTAAALSILALFVTGSRTPMLVFVGALLAQSIVTMTKTRSKMSLYSIVAFVIFVLVAASGALNSGIDAISNAIGVADPLTRIGETSVRESNRFHSILQGMDYWLQSPIIGRGFNAYSQLTKTVGFAYGANISNVLNQVVQTLVDCGVLGLAALIAFFWSSLVTVPARTSAKFTDDEFGIRIWLISFVLINQSATFITTFYHFTAFIFALLGYSLRSSLETKKYKEYIKMHGIRSARRQMTRHLLRMPSRLI